ncbi:MAG: 2Fe-2S iron-sulfur cluster-binding protein [Polyangiaceae bacterium]|jgi:2Fe-2S ferredoxin
MATIRFVGFRDVVVAAGKSILDAAVKARVPVGSACGGVCACSTCHVYVVSGSDGLSAEQDEEADALDRGFDVRASSRLGCQARVTGEGTIDVEIARESLESYEHEHPDERGKYTKKATKSSVGA